MKVTSARVAVDFLNNVPNPSDHVVFFDNFFTSHDLLVFLKQKVIRAIGIMRGSRTKKYLFKSKVELKKKQ